MSKNYADIYASENDSVSLEQRWYFKQETTRGTLIGPANADYLWALEGGSITYAQPRESSPHRSGRHNTSTIKKKKETSWSLPTYFNIDESLGSFSAAEVDTPVRLLWKSLMGKEVVSGSAVTYTTATPANFTMSIHEVGDKWAYQSRGAFTQDGDIKLPGDGESMITWSGDAAEALMVGIGKSVVDNSGGNVVAVGTGEGWSFPTGCLVMIVKSDGVTRSTDTASGTYRKVTSNPLTDGDNVTVDGAALADADGSTSPVYLVYAEPSAPTAINNPVTGLVGSASFSGLSIDCFRQVGIKISNGHEKVDYCFGMDALSGTYFVPGSRVNIMVTAELNQNEKLVRFFNQLQSFQAKVMSVRLGAASGRRLEFALPKVDIPPPAFQVPSNGSIPITFEGTAEQTALDAADELTVAYK